MRKAFDGYDEPVNIDLEPEEALLLVLEIRPAVDEESSSE
jgi:hypothetical protein